jgi:hypothetical protein
MLSRFYQNTLAAFTQWFEALLFTVKPAPIPVRIRVESAEQLRLAARRQGALQSKYRG